MWLRHSHRMGYWALWTQICLLSAHCRIIRRVSFTLYKHCDVAPSPKKHGPESWAGNTLILIVHTEKLEYQNWKVIPVQFSSVHFSHSVMSDSLRPHGLQHARPPCPSPTPRVYSNSCPLSRWCHPTISSSVVPFSSCLQSFPASGSFQMSQHFASGGQSIGVSASTSVLPMSIQNWFLLGWTCWISLQSKGLLHLYKWGPLRQITKLALITV